MWGALMSSTVELASPPEYNVTSIDFFERDHFRYIGPPLIDVHAHVWVRYQGRPLCRPHADDRGISRR